MAMIFSPQIDDDEFNKFCSESLIFEEGKAKMHLPKKLNVFYNPIQEFNRDISICVIKSFCQVYERNFFSKKTSVKYLKNIDKSKDHKVSIDMQFLFDPEKLDLNREKLPKQVTILEALSATGIRAIRYCLEIESIFYVIANDISLSAVKSIAMNSKLNEINEKCIPVKMDASKLMYLLKSAGKYRPDIIDIDPYGSCSEFLDSAVRSVSDGGLLCLTSTDMAVLCGNYPETAHAKYGSLSLKSPFCHEMALRILLFSLDCAANRYKRYIIPLLSMSVDFYIRVFVKVVSSAEESKNSILKKSYVIFCHDCGTFLLQPGHFRPTSAPIGQSSCNICGGNLQVGGPVWSHPLNDKEFVNMCIKDVERNDCIYGTKKRITGILHVIKEELHDVPFYYVVDKAFSIVRCSVPPSLELHSAFVHMGFNVSSTHCNKIGLKTNASPEDFFDIVNAWLKKIGKKDHKVCTNAAKAILSRPINDKINFLPIQSLKPFSKTSKMVRFQQNPKPCWGPQKRGKISLVDDEKRSK